MNTIDWTTFSQTLKQHHPQLGDLHIQSIKPISGGDIHPAYQLHTPTQNYFLKINTRDCLPLFEAEADSLTALNQSHTLTCPQHYGTGHTHQHAWLLLEYLPLTPHGDDHQRGRDLALLHQTHAPNHQYGWHQDNFIGYTPQTNSWHTDWVTFYRDHRLHPQLTLAQQKGLPAQTLTLANQLLDMLPQFFQTYTPAPSLLHGDLWSGNSAFHAETGDPIFYDPASYYGDRETDLAMTELFGGFSDAFYQGYQSIYPLDSGYPQRKPLYQLYHLLNHYNLFGGHYAQSVHKTLKQLHQI